MNNHPIFKINGLERRALKKELSLLKYFIRSFWHYHQIDKDMASVYGSSGDFPMSDEIAQVLYDKKVSEMERLDYDLSILYDENIK